MPPCGVCRGVREPCFSFIFSCLVPPRDPLWCATRISLRARVTTAPNSLRRAALMSWSRDGPAWLGAKASVSLGLKIRVVPAHSNSVNLNPGPHCAAAIEPRCPCCRHLARFAECCGRWDSSRVVSCSSDVLSLLAHRLRSGLTSLTVLRSASVWAVTVHSNPQELGDR